MKDAWNTAYKNFLHLAYLLTFFSLVFLYLYFFKMDGVDVTLATVLFILIPTIAWYYLAHLFKVRDRKATTIGLIIVGISFASSLLGLNLIGIVITGYFLYLVYKASKVPAAVV